MPRILPVFIVAGALVSGCGGSHRGPAQPLPFPKPSGGPTPTAPAPPIAAPATSAEAKPEVAAPRTASSAEIAVQHVIETARAQLGIPYRYGGESPTNGFDCSGLVQFAFERAGIDLPRTVDEQFGRGVRVGLPDVQPGDLIFFTTTGPGATHVGIAIGQGQFVHAPSSTGVVRIERYDAPYWHDRFLGARRIF